MTLPEILREAIRHLKEGLGRVVIVRGAPRPPARGNAEGSLAPLDIHGHAFQVRLRHDVSMGLSAYRCKARTWLGARWSSWRERRGWFDGGSFDVDDVLAIDRCLEPGHSQSNEATL